MDPVILSRLQFGLTTVYHFFFVPLTLGMGWFVAYMQTRYYQTKDETYHEMAKFWGHLFLINFAIGVVTGIVQEFQFGMNWSEYSRFVGDIFGAPLAIEALLAFFMESTFLGIWVFGEGRVPDKVHLASIWMVAIGSNLSALWILLANGWMQHPVGYLLDPVSGRPLLVDFLALALNPKGWIFFFHTISAGVATASFLIISISAYHIAGKHQVDVFKRSFQIVALVGLVAGALVFLGGHTQGQYIYETQPMKMASIEALWFSEKPASFSVITIGDLSGKKEVWSLRLPAVTSFLACNNFKCEVRGVEDLQVEYTQLYGPGDYIPLMVFTYWGFRIMMTSGLLMMLLAALFLWALRGNIETSRWMKWVPWVIVLPYAANMSGWILTEMGRQPWIVQGMLTVQKAVSPNFTTVDLLISLIGFALLYGALAVADVYLMKKYATAGIDTPQATPLEAAPAMIGAAVLEEETMSHEALQTLWFILIAVLWIGFFFLEGFDFGVGMLLPFLGKKDNERRALINTIGSVWDGNEVWLLTAGGATFAAFPQWYATMFSGFYLALFLLLVGLIIRGIAFEYRSKDDNPQWRHTFDWMIAVGSFLAALLLGTAFANLARGVPINEKMMYTGNLFTLLNPYGLIGGVTMVSVFLLHGANFLTLKLEGDLRERAHNLSKKLYVAAAAMVIILSISTYFYTDILTKIGVNPGVIPIAAVVLLLTTIFFINQRREGWAFIFTGLHIALTQVAFFTLMFPRVMISSTNPAWNLTIFNASSSQYTLTVMSIVALIFVPIVLVYQGWTYYMFRKRLTTQPESLVY